MDQIGNICNEVIEKNDSYYAPIWMGKATFSTHLNQIKQTRLWDTQVELQATIDLVGVPVYAALLNTKGVYSWNLFKPCRIHREDPTNGLSRPVYPFSQAAPDTSIWTRKHVCL